MKNTFKKIITGAIIMIFPLSLLFGCGGTEKAKGEAVHTAPAVENYVEGEELLCIAGSRSEAEEIAKMYQIELVDFSYGVATFHTEEDPRAVIERGKEKGYPELSINGYSELY